MFDRYAVWTDRDGRMWKQDYSVGSDGSVAWSGTAVEVTRKVSYEDVTNHRNLEQDPVKPLILAALNAAGVSTEGLDDAALDLTLSRDDLEGIRDRYLITKVAMKRSRAGGHTCDLTLSRRGSIELVPEEG